jgi:hypothetical protein
VYGREIAMAQSHQAQVDKNFEVFSKRLPELLQSHPGKYAILHEGDVIDFFDTLSDAVKFGHSKFGDMNFSVQEVTRQSATLGFHSYAVHQHSN